MIWTPTRAAGLDQLEAFLPRAGRDYARDRNTDRGPQDRSNVSALSPWIRRRLVTEEEVVRAVLTRHELSAAEKFIQEVFWRTYWKGWLELRPGVWRRYQTERARLEAAFEGDARLAKARAGRTGIACFDAWVEELRESGWLHNHTRMWFASIWIFTLRLPWELGAGLFLDHLLDADPASNTLSWRWVAGLHTRGKHYLARAENIRTHTRGRFDPTGELDERALPLGEDWTTPAPAPLPVGAQPRALRVALLLTEEDLHPESWAPSAEIAAAAVLPSAAMGEGPAARFSRGALEDAAARAEGRFGVTVERARDAQGFARLCARAGADELVTAHAPVGPIADHLSALEPALAAAGVRLVRLLRRYDARAWPHATAGFFKFREKIPALCQDLAS